MQVLIITMRSIKHLCSLLLFLLVSNLNAQQKLEIHRLKQNFYIFTTYMAYKGSLTPANGMYLITKQGAVLFDTPWDTTQFQPLLDSIEKYHKKKVILAFATHSHEDRTAGLEFLNSKGILTYTSWKTDIVSKDHHNKRASHTFRSDTLFSIGEYIFNSYYPGPGHTKDNIVFWFPQNKILYGGCFIKSTEAIDLGNLSDADLTAWPVSLNNVKQKFPNPEFIIPGHDSWLSKNSLDHTLRLLEKKSE